MRIHSKCLFDQMTKMPMSEIPLTFGVSDFCFIRSIFSMILGFLATMFYHWLFFVIVNSSQATLLRWKVFRDQSKFAWVNQQKDQLLLFYLPIKFKLRIAISKLETRNLKSLSTIFKSDTSVPKFEVFYTLTVHPVKPVTV